MEWTETITVRERAISELIVRIGCVRERIVLHIAVVQLMKPRLGHWGTGTVENAKMNVLPLVLEEFRTRKDDEIIMEWTETITVRERAISELIVRIGCVRERIVLHIAVVQLMKPHLGHWGTGTVENANQVQLKI